MAESGRGGQAPRRTVELDRRYLESYSSHMKAASVTEVKNRLSHYLRAVADGETVTILDRGRPVAQLTPVIAEEDDAASGGERDRPTGAGTAAKEFL